MGKASNGYRRQKSCGCSPRSPWSSPSRTPAAAGLQHMDIPVVAPCHPRLQHLPVVTPVTGEMGWSPRRAMTSFEREGEAWCMLQPTLKIVTTSMAYSYNRNRVLLHRTTIHFLAGIDAAPRTAVAAPLDCGSSSCGHCCSSPCPVAARHAGGHVSPCHGCWFQLVKRKIIRAYAE